MSIRSVHRRPTGARIDKPYYAWCEPKNKAQRKVAEAIYELSQKYSEGSNPHPDLTVYFTPPCLRPPEQPQTQNPRWRTNT